MALAAVADGMDANSARARQVLEALRRRELIAELGAMNPESGAPVDLEDGLMLIARFGDPAADLPRARRELDSLAARLAGLPGPDRGPLPQLEALNRHLRESLGFTRERAADAAPDACYLHRVVERRSGLPIALAAVWILVGRRLGATVHGINMPGHFLGAWDANGRRVFFDPAEGGRALSRGDCARLLSQAGVAFSDTLLSPVPARLILIRTINRLIELNERRGGEGAADVAWWERLRAVLVDDEAGQGVATQERR